MNTLAYSGTEKSFADWGITGAHREVENQFRDQFACDFANPFDANDDFAFGDEIIIRIGRTGSGTTWSGGKIDFIGYRVENYRTASYALEQLTYKFDSAWGQFFDRLVFQQQFGSWSGTDHVSIPLYRAQLVLGSTYSGARQGLSETIAEVVNYVRSQMNAQLSAYKIQLGSSFDSTLFPLDAVNNITCAEALRRLFRWIGSASLWIDYSTSPPSIQCKTRDTLTAVNLAITDAEQIRIKRRDDLVPPCIHFQYRRQVTYDNLTYTQVLYDTASDSGYVDTNGNLTGGKTVDSVFIPATTPIMLADSAKFGAVVQTFDFEGPTTKHAKAEISTIPFAPTSLDFWLKLCPELNQALTGTLSIVPDNLGNLYTQSDALADSSLIYAVTEGSVTSWMANPAKTQTLVVNAYFAGTFSTFDSRKMNTWLQQPKQVQVTVTNVPGGTYYSEPESSSGEALPWGLAKLIWDVEKIPQYQGSYTLTEQDYTGSIGVGNVLNMTGGRAEWATMNAQVQSISIDYDRGQTQINFGPATHLGAGDLIERLRANRGPRMIYLIGNNKQNQADSKVLDLGKPSKNNSTSGVPVQSFIGGFETNNTGATGNSAKLGKWYLDATTLMLGIEGLPYTSETNHGDGELILKLGEITAPVEAMGGDPLTNPEQRKRSIHLREVPYFDTDGKKYFQTIAASEKYSKTIDDGSMSGLPVWL